LVYGFNGLKFPAAPMKRDLGFAPSRLQGIGGCD